jgi:putative hydrolase of the HAD superfamily
VLFDAAGTLIELREPVGETYARCARAHGVELPAWRLEDAFARILRGARPMVFPDAAADRIAELERAWWRDVVRGTFLAADSSVRFADFEAFFGDLWARFDGARAWRAREGARAALAALRARGLRTAVVSNFDQRLHRILAELGLSQLLDAVVLPGEARAAKPDPRIFALALARLGVAARDAVCVGDDRERDLAGARAAGVSAVDVREHATLEGLAALLAPESAATGVDPR